MTVKNKWRYIAMGVLFIGCFAILIARLATLQVRNTDEYSDAASVSMTKTIYEKGSRGQIVDVNGTLLAYNKKIYNVQFYREPNSDGKQNALYSKAIWEVIKLVEAEGKEVSFAFYLAPNEDGTWRFDFGTEDEAVAARREEMFRGNFYVKNLDLQDIYEKLCSNYGIHKIDTEEEQLTLEDKLKVLSVWQEMQMNAFNSVPITLVTDVKWSTATELETRLISLPGISISVEDQRVYPKGTLACHILGYTGLIQSGIDDYLEMGYQRNDRIGLDGVEKTMEQWLTGSSGLRRGYTIVEVDRSGRRIRELEKQAPTDGNTVKLTIDASLQKVAEDALAATVNKIRDYEEKLILSNNWLETNKDTLLEYDKIDRDINYAQNGAIVVLDMECRVLAMASYPNYDPNLFILGMDDEQFARMFEDPRHPLYNNAIQAADTPGSVFKMATALAALANGKLTTSETISDGGPFTDYDKTNPPKCWIAPNKIYLHADQTIVEGLSHSCNYFFYTLASRLGDDGELLYQYAAKLGLASKTNIDLPGEKKSVVGSQISLYDPTRAINGYDQDTWLPVQVKNQLKNHFKKIGEKYNIVYSDERLDKCIKSLMDMAVKTEQGDKQETWMRAIRPILMEELGMSMELVWRAEVMTDTVRLLNEIKWGGSYSIMTAIGQSITMTTPVAMARYIAAIANGGYVYDVQLIDSIISPTGETIRSFDEPVLVNDLHEELEEYLPYIKQGMKDVVNDGGTANTYFSNFSYLDQVAGKTGTAETSDLDIESNAWFVSFVPFDEPEIVVVVYVPYGYSGARASEAAKTVIQYYLDSRVDESAVVLPAPNSLAP